MKIAGYVALALICFVITLGAALFLSGNLSKEGLDKLTGRGEAAAAAERETDNLGPLVRALKEREAKLNEEQAKLREEKARLEKMRADLESLRNEVKAIQDQIASSLEQADSDQEVSRQEVARSLAEMKPQNAADTLKGWPVDEAAATLLLVKDKDRAKIFDSMEPERASEVLRAIQQRRM